MRVPPREASLIDLDPDPPDPRRGDTIRVLLIEDSEVDARVLAAMLTDQGCAVFRAATLAEGTAHLQTAAVDVVILDLELPDARGMQSVEQIRSAFPHMPTVVVTAREDHGLGARALQVGAQDYLNKGALDVGQVVRALRYAMARKQSERLRLRLEHTDRLASLGQLAAGIAHEINNPLAFVMANMELEQEHVEAFAELCDALAARLGDHPDVAALLQRVDYQRRLSELAEMLSDNSEGVERMRTIVKGLRGFARSDSDQLTPVDLNETVQTAVNITRNEIRHRARLVANRGELPLISGDQARLCQVVVNLLINAAQATEEGKADKNQIEVTTLAAGNGITLQVRDTGCGIREADLPRIFEPFFTTKARDKGTGLGLSLCAETVRRHGGHLEVKSEAGVGTTFELHLPVDVNVERGPGVPPTPRVSNGHGRLLLVDDDGAVRKAFSRTLRRDGYEVIQAGSVTEALQLLERDRAFDAIICDLVMPDLDGPDLYQHLRKDYPTLCERLLFISGGAFTERAQAFLAETNVTVLAKPPRPRALEDAIRSVTGAG